MGYIKIDFSDKSKNLVEFERLHPGELFGYDGHIFIKTDRGTIQHNGFNLIDNTKYTLSNNTLVKKLNGILTNIKEDV